KLGPPPGVYPWGGLFWLLDPGKISFFARYVCQTSGPVVGAPNFCAGSGVSRTPAFAGQFRAMNSCHANAAAVCNEAFGAPPGTSDGKLGLIVMAGGGSCAPSGGCRPQKAIPTAPRIPIDQQKNLDAFIKGSFRWRACRGGRAPLRGH